ncbi:hypothetical protein Phum_PHUM364050 [Pediculus humanus corporis]|uniref:Uncharacterized protein n=1 Tax=Pediculus humanus subsp. corporis TaxID=121224 RepID=E0VPS8_PEDHC|nr:uncharacterized protein Phum_PHUM364050 [Pediculus humanus corporis]EEB15384.1 hypothetical protein Phum_PHUM364050 [Pediculus humanus corporis]
MEDKHQPDSSNSVQMGIKHKQGMPMQSQFEQAILDVYDFCMKEKEAGVPIIPLNHFAKRVTEMLKISDSSVKRVLKKRENGIPLAPLKRKRNRKSPITDVDDYTKDAIARKVHAYSFQEKQFTMGAFLEECKADLGFKGCEKSLRRILEKQLGFEFKKVDNKLKIEQKKVKKGKVKGEKTVKVLRKTKTKNSPVSVSIQTQTVSQPPQTIPILDITMGHRGNTMEDMSTVHRIHHMEDTSIQHRNHPGDTIEHMAMAGLVAHRTNVIENMAIAHRANEMVIQQHQRVGDMTVINDYRSK